MARPRTDRERKRRTFINALASGRSVKEAADHAGIAWSTLYSWRQNSRSFATAWDCACECAEGALYERLEAALIQRAVEGVEEPLFHKGLHIGYRKRYSDTLLLAGLRQLGGYGASTKPYILPPRDEEAPPRVIVNRFGLPDDEGGSKPLPLAAPKPEAASTPPHDGSVGTVADASVSKSQP